MVKIGEIVKVTDEKHQPGKPFNKGGFIDSWPSVGEQGVVEVSYEKEHGYYKEWVNIVWIRFPNHHGSWPFPTTECEVVFQS